MKPEVLRPDVSPPPSQPAAQRVRTAGTSFHVRSAAIGIACVVALVLVALVRVAHAQTEVVSVTTTTTLQASSATVAPGAPVTFTARVDADRGAVPGGHIDFFDEATMVWLGRADVASPSITVTNLSPGAHPIRAHYTGTTAFLPFIALPSSSAVLVQRVQAAPRLEISTTPNPGGPGAPLTLSATVTARSGMPTGMVTFRDGDQILAARVRLDRSGRATFMTSALSGGVHAITAEYEGDVRFARTVATVRLNVAESAAASPFAGVMLRHD